MTFTIFYIAVQTENACVFLQMDYALKRLSIARIYHLTFCKKSNMTDKGFDRVACRNAGLLKMKILEQVSWAMSKPNAIAYLGQCEAAWNNLICCLLKWELPEVSNYNYYISVFSAIPIGRMPSCCWRITLSRTTNFRIGRHTQYNNTAYRKGSSGGNLVKAMNILREQDHNTLHTESS